MKVIIFSHVGKLFDDYFERVRDYPGKAFFVLIDIDHCLAQMFPVMKATTPQWQQRSITTTLARTERVKVKAGKRPHCHSSRWHHSICTQLIHLAAGTYYDDGC